jgi:hypothetical protein
MIFFKYVILIKFRELKFVAVGKRNLNLFIKSLEKNKIINVFISESIFFIYDKEVITTKRDNQFYYGSATNFKC